MRSFLVVDRPPDAGDAERWLADFAAAVTAREPASSHVAIDVDVAAPFTLPADFVAAGLAQETATTLTLTRARLLPPARR